AWHRILALAGHTTDRTRLAVMLDEIGTTTNTRRRSEVVGLDPEQSEAAAQAFELARRYGYDRGSADNR
ncbi:MAG: hypothetical protein R3320_13675, partial [Nitriliruptorales bacterium]|nr:hypothetical protein [Nitriliruptorales bacterium]